MSKLTPVAWIDKDYKAFHWHQQVGHTVEPLDTDIPLFTESQLNQARADALREAAERMDIHIHNITDPVLWLRRVAAEIEKGSEK